MARTRPSWPVMEMVSQLRFKANALTYRKDSLKLFCSDQRPKLGTMKLEFEAHEQVKNARGVKSTFKYAISTLGKIRACRTRLNHSQTSRDVDNHSRRRYNDTYMMGCDGASADYRRIVNVGSGPMGSCSSSAMKLREPCLLQTYVRFAI